MDDLLSVFYVNLEHNLAQTLLHLVTTIWK